MGALTLVGIPFTAGFASKWFFAQAGLAYGSLRMILVFAALVISTALNVVYFMGAIIRIFSPADDGLSRPDKRVGPLRYVALAGLAGQGGRGYRCVSEGLQRAGAGGRLLRTWGGSPRTPREQLARLLSALSCPQEAQSSAGLPGVQAG